jgi:single-strand DNA-binding protein
MNLNKAFVLGRLTADPQLRTTPSGAQVASFSVATNRIWNDRSGAKQQDVQYHNIVVWGRQAEIVSQFLSKGSLVLVEGRLQTRIWQNKEGQNQRTTEIIGERIQLGPRNIKQREEGFKPAPNSPAPGTGGSAPEEFPEIDLLEEEIKPEDLPF